MTRDTTAESALGPFEYRFSPSFEFIGLARHTLDGWLQAQPIADLGGVHDLVLACSELCTNAVESAGADGSVALRAFSEDDGAVVIEVEDDGGGGEHGWRTPPHWTQHGAWAESGRGLFIVDQVTDSLEVNVADGRTRVRCSKAGVLA